MSAAPPTLTHTSESRFGAWFQRTEIWSRYVLQQAITELRKLNTHAIPSHPVILDAGCGDGAAFELMTKLYKPSLLVGIELDQTMAANATSTARKMNNTAVINADILETNLAPDSIDLILCHQTLHHVADQPGVLQKFRDILKPTGVLFLSESCKSFTQSPLVRLLFRHNEETQHTAEGFRELIETTGFYLEPVNVSTPDPWWGQPAMGLLSKAKIPHNKRAATQICIAARNQSVKKAE